MGATAIKPPPGYVLDEPDIPDPPEGYVLDDTDLDQMPEALVDNKDKIRNSLYYSKQFGLPPETAYDLEPQLNQQVFGTEKLSDNPAKLFYEAFKQSLADKPAMMLKGAEVYTPGKALGMDSMLDKASVYLRSLQDPDTKEQLQKVASGKLWPTGDDKRWWQVEAKYLPEVINSWAVNVADQIPIMLTTIAGRMAGKVIGKPIGAAAGLATAAVTGGPDPSDVVTAPPVVAITSEVVKHLGGAAPLVAMEAGNFVDEADSLEIDRDIIEKYAKGYGLGSGAIEYAQWLWVLGRYSKITKPAQKTIMKEVLTHIGGSMFEGVEEVSQQGLQNFLMQKAVAEMKERHPEYQGQAPKITEGLKRSGQIGTGVAFITGMPGTGMTITQGALARRQQVKPETKKFLDEPSVAEVEQAAKVAQEPPKAKEAPIVPPKAEIAEPAAEKAVPAVAEKKPWEMTREEVSDLSLDEFNALDRQLAKEYGELIDKRVRGEELTASEKATYDKIVEFVDLLHENRKQYAAEIEARQKVADEAIRKGEPWKVTQKQYLANQITGYIDSDAYDEATTVAQLKKADVEQYSEIVDSFTDNAGRKIEIRESPEALKYVKVDAERQIVRDEKGNAVYQSVEEMKAKGLPTTGGDFIAVSDGKEVGSAFNSFGVPEILVNKEYQRSGIGKKLLQAYIAKWKPRRLGQSTPQGRNLAASLHKDIVQQALKQGKPVPRHVLEEYKSEEWAQEAISKVEAKPPEASIGAAAAGFVTQNKALERAVKQSAKTGQDRYVVQGETGKYTTRAEPPKKGHYTVVKPSGEMTFIKQASETAEAAFDYGEQIKWQEAFKGDLEKFQSKLTQKNADVKSIQDELFTMVKASGMTPAKVKSVLGLLRNIRPENQVKTNLKNLMKAISRATQYTEDQNRRLLTSAIRKQLKKAKPKKKEGILKGKFTADVQNKLDDIASHIDDDRDLMRAKMLKNMDAYDKGEIAYEEMRLANEQLSMRGIKGMTSQELLHVLENVKSLKEGGKTIRQAERDANTERVHGIRSAVMRVVTGDKGLKAGRQSVPRRQLATQAGFLEKLINWQYGWDNLLDKLSKLHKSEPYQSPLSQFGNEVHRAEALEAASTVKWMSQVRDAAARIFDAKTDSQINAELNRLTEETTLGPFANADGAEITLTLTRDQLIKKYMELQDPTLEATFIGGVNEDTGRSYGMRWTDEIIEAVQSELTSQEKAWADWQMAFYRRYYNSVNAVYRQVYGVDLPFNPMYSPINRDVDIEIPENVLLAKEAVHYASTVNGSLKSRQANVKALKFTSATQVLVNHILRMEHFKAWNDTMSDLRRIFGNPDIRRGIEQYHGMPILKTIDEFMQDMARGGVAREKINRTADTLRRNFTKAILGFKPAIALKQIPSVLAYSTEMPLGDFVAGVADFWADPVGHYKFLTENSSALKKRWGEGFERDIRFAMKQDWVKQLSGKTDVTRWFMGLIRAGDKFATMQGAWAQYQSQRKAGKSQEAAIAAAEDTTNRTQPTSEISTLAPGQRGGSLLKLWTMFQNQPNKYFRIIADNARNLKYHRGSPIKAAANIVTAWAVLPMLFQFIADAFRLKKEKQLQASLLGPINNLLIIGGLAKQMIGWATGELYEYQGTPIVSTTQKLQRGMTKTSKIIKDTASPASHIDMDDVVSAVEYFAEAGGQLAGVPTPYMVQAEKAVREGRAAELVFSRYSLKDEKKKSKRKAIP
jgi:GNAT superfamily N-acetyltransferase